LTEDDFVRNAADGTGNEKVKAKDELDRPKRDNGVMETAAIEE
jgi:hypothetical protein